MSRSIKELTLPLPLNLANSRMHWRKKNREKKNYFSNCDLLLAGKQLPRPPRKPWERAEITVTMYLYSYMDDDNAMARLKWPIDYLRKAGYITDDRKRNLEYTGLPSQQIDRKNQRLEITLEKM